MTDSQFVDAVLTIAKQIDDSATARVAIEALLKQMRIVEDARQRAFAAQRKQEQRTRGRDVTVTEDGTSPGHERDISVTEAGRESAPVSPYPSEILEPKDKPVSGDLGIRRGPGNQAAELVGPTLARLTGRDYADAADLHRAAEEAFRADGFEVQREVSAPIGPKQGGRVDLVAKLGTVTVGIELDNVTIRGRSLLKLTGNAYDVRLAVLRTGEPGYRTPPPGVDVMFCVGSKPSREVRAPALDGFEAWYAAYPRKTARAEAEKAWRQTERQRPSLEAMLAALEWQREAWSDPQFIPYPGSYLRAHRWADERPALVARSQPGLFGRASLEQQASDVVQRYAAKGLTP